MDVRGIAEQEAAAVAEAFGAAMVDAVSREPMTGRERQTSPADLEKRLGRFDDAGADSVIAIVFGNDREGTIRRLAAL